MPGYNDWKRNARKRIQAPEHELKEMFEAENETVVPSSSEENIVSDTDENMIDILEKMTALQRGLLIDASMNYKSNNNPFTEDWTEEMRILWNDGVVKREKLKELGANIEPFYPILQYATVPIEELLRMYNPYNEMRRGPRP